MRIALEHRTDYPTAKLRALICLAALDRRVFAKASQVGYAIWPGTMLRAQGLGGAASRILRRMEKEGLACWSSNGEDWGWKITDSGRSLVHL